MPKEFDDQASRNAELDTMCYDKGSAEIFTTAGWASPGDTFSESSVRARIAAFLDGKTCGADLLHALYDHVLDEPIPEAMYAILDK